MTFIMDSDTHNLNICSNNENAYSLHSHLFGPPITILCLRT